MFQGVAFIVLSIIFILDILAHDQECRWIRKDTEDMRKVEEIVFSEEDPMEMHEQLIRLFDKRNAIK